MGGESRRLTRAIEPVESLKQDIHSAEGTLDVVIFEVEVLVLGELLGACEQCVCLVCVRGILSSLCLYITYPLSQVSQLYSLRCCVECSSYECPHMLPISSFCHCLSLHMSHTSLHLSPFVFFISSSRIFTFQSQIPLLLYQVYSWSLVCVIQ